MVLFPKAFILKSDFRAHERCQRHRVRGIMIFACFARIFPVLLLCREVQGFSCHPTTVRSSCPVCMRELTSRSPSSRYSSRIYSSFFGAANTSCHLVIVIQHVQVRYYITRFQSDSRHAPPQFSAPYTFSIGYRRIYIHNAIIAAPQFPSFSYYLNTTVTIFPKPRRASTGLYRSLSPMLLSFVHYHQLTNRAEQR